LVNGFKKIQNIFGNKKLSTIDSTKSSEDQQFKMIFDEEEFAVNLNPEIIYQKKEK